MFKIADLFVIIPSFYVKGRFDGELGHLSFCRCLCNFLNHFKVLFKYEVQTCVQPDPFCTNLQFLRSTVAGYFGKTLTVAMNKTRVS